jgi:hypothetical protein
MLGCILTVLRYKRGVHSCPLSLCLSPFAFILVPFTLFFRDSVYSVRDKAFGFAEVHLEETF